jgi:hypothetical protein
VQQELLLVVEVEVLKIIQVALAVQVLLELEN